MAQGMTMVFTLISLGLGLIVAIPISNIENSKKRKITYWVVGIVGFVLVAIVMISLAISLGRDPVGAPGGSGLMFAIGLGAMAWQRAKSKESIS
jgi:FtsH-binding integral membrane protein